MELKAFLRDVNHFGSSFVFLLFFALCIIVLFISINGQNKSNLPYPSNNLSNNIRRSENKCSQVARINYDACLNKCNNHITDTFNIATPNGYSYQVNSGPNFISCNKDCTFENDRQTNLCNLNY